MNIFDVMRSLAALLAAFAFLAVLQACGGAEPNAPRQREASLTLDFRPNAVHTGIYAAQGSGALSREGIDLEIREPSATAQPARLLAAGRTDFAVLDVADLATARSQGLPLTAVAAIVEKPLAAVVVGPGSSGTPDTYLDGATVGVTGTPSDDLVLDTVLDAQGLTTEDVERINVGFGAVPALTAGRLDAATAFWNSEGVQLRLSGVPSQELRVERFGAPEYPQLLLAVNERITSPGSELVCSVVTGLRQGNRLAVSEPNRGLDYLMEAIPSLDRRLQKAQLRALVASSALPPSVTADPGSLRAWLDWSVEGGLFRAEQKPAIEKMIQTAGSRCAQSS